MSVETDFLCHSVTLHAERVRELVAEINAARTDSSEWLDAVGALIGRAEYLANRAKELAAICKEHK